MLPPSKDGATVALLGWPVSMLKSKTGPGVLWQKLGHLFVVLAVSLQVQPLVMLLANIRSIALQACCLQAKVQRTTKRI